MLFYVIGVLVCYIYVINLLAGQGLLDKHGLVVSQIVALGTALVWFVYLPWRAIHTFRQVNKLKTKAKR